MATRTIGAAGRFAEASTTQRARGSSIATPTFLLCAGLALPQLLLWRFLGVSDGWAALGAAALVGWLVLIGRGVARHGPAARPAGLRLIVACLAIALVVLVLGGEGRFVYANTDWQVRNALLRDLTLYPWPFAYDGAAPLLLRAPLGMYLAPAMVGKALGYRAAELALLAQNAALLAILLVLGATLYRGARARAIALCVFLGFSGMDLLGSWIVGAPLDGHLENWIGPQYSSHVTQVFWVPQHALAGWAGALLYLLWRERVVPLAALLAPLPLLALWSPLALIGVLPFAAHAGIATIARRGLSPAAVLLPAASVLLALPSLLYLATAGGSVGGGVRPLGAARYIVFELIEVAPYLAAAGIAGRRSRFGGTVLVLVAFVLLLAPLGRIGQSVDFVMRASIPALLILALAIADLLIAPTAGERGRFARHLALLAFAIGLATPLSEVARAFRYPRAPEERCSYLGVVPGGSANYLAPLAAVPPPLRPERATLVTPREPARCWNGPWPMPPGGAR